MDARCDFGGVSSANLMCYVRPRITDIPIHFPHDTNMLVAVQEGVFLVPHTCPSATMGRFVCL